jgi:hypothetical protein
MLKWLVKKTTFHSEAMVVVHYKTPQSKVIAVFNPKGYDYPLTIQVKGEKCTFSHQENQAVGKPPRGEYYFRPLSLGERLTMAQKAIEAEIEAMLSDGRIKKPQDKTEQSRLDNFITRSKLSKAPRIAENYRQFLVVDTW